MARSALEAINASIRALPGSPVHRVDPAFHRLQWNENPFDYPADLKEEVLQRLAWHPWSRYPLGLRAYDLMEALAAYYGLTPGHVVVGTGSSDLLRIVAGATLEPGRHLVVPSPTFGAYRRHALLLGAAVHEVPLDPVQGFALPVDELLAQATAHQARLIVVCAPNNPTGTVYALDDLRRLAAESNALLMVDAAYAEFSGLDYRPLLQEFENVVVVHTFSKAFAFAGGPFGYALTAPTIAAELQKLVTVFTLNPFAESAAIVALEHADRFRAQVERIVTERTRLADTLGALPGVTVFPSGANFLCVRLDRPARDVQAQVAGRHRLLVSDLSVHPGYEQYLRISVGTPEQNDLVAYTLGEVLAQPVA